MTDIKLPRLYMLFDTETTSLVSNTILAEHYQPEIIEFYGCSVLGDGTQTDELHFMCKPSRPIPKEVTDITGITNEMVENAPPFSACYTRILSYMSKHDGVVAHNLAFDTEVLKIEAARLKQLESLYFPRIKICTVESTEWIKGRRMNLSELHETLTGHTFSGAHRAKEDVQALRRIFTELMRRGDI